MARSSGNKRHTGIADTLKRKALAKRTTFARNTNPRTQEAIMQTNPEQWAVDFAHELWPMAQVGPSEGIEDAALRIAEAIQAAFAEREARLVGQWVFPKSINDMPKKPGKEAYEYVECLVMHKGDMIARPWNCEHQVFDDEAQDEFFCEWHEVTAYIDLTQARQALAALKDRTDG